MIRRNVGNYLSAETPSNFKTIWNYKNVIKSHLCCFQIYGQWSIYENNADLKHTDNIEIMEKEMTSAWERKLK